MRRIIWLQAYLAIMLVAAALFVETGGTRLHLPGGRYYDVVRSYTATDHTGEVVFMGSSVVEFGVIPDAVRDGLRQRGLGQKVYNLYLSAGLTPTYKTALRDLVLTNGKPELVVLCISPRDLNDNSAWLDDYIHDFASLSDVVDIVGHDPWGRHALLWPLLSRSSAGLAQTALAWVGFVHGGQTDDALARRRGAFWDYQDGSAEAARRNSESAGALDEERYQKALEAVRTISLVAYDTEESREPLDDTIAMAKAANIAVALCLFDYSDEAREALAGGYTAETERILAELARKHDVAYWRTSAVWPPIRQRASHFDGVYHLTPDAAMAISRAFGEGPVADLLLDVQ